MKAQTKLGFAAAVWGVGGFLAVLAFAIYRLTPIAIEAFDTTWRWYHWITFIGNTLFMAYSEGYRGFQKGYSPRLVARARELACTATILTAVLAPLYCMNYFAVEKRRVIAAWVLTVMIVVLIIVFHQLPQPWRGLLDAGVVVGLSWGLIATLACVFNPMEASAQGSGQYPIDLTSKASRGQDKSRRMA